MIKLWRDFRHLLDPYYELSSDELERLIVAKEHYTDALFCLETVGYAVNEQIQYLRRKVEIIDAALKKARIKDKESDFPF